MLRLPVDKNRVVKTTPGDSQPYIPARRIPLPVTTAEQRRHAFSEAGYNQFELRASKVSIDWLTDSGTGAVSVAQEEAAANADPSYAQSDSWFRLRDAISELADFPYVFSPHQGRAAESLLMRHLLSPGQIAIANTFFDTTGENVRRAGCETWNLPCEESKDFTSDDPFKGNINLAELKNALSAHSGRVGMVLMTLTNNGLGGQPVSMECLEAVRKLCDEYGVPLILDAARFAENAWLVKRREPGYADWTPAAIARRAYALADGCVQSLKKDGISPMGAFLGLRDAELAAKVKKDLIATGGFVTYGGMSAMDQERCAVGLREVVQADYLQSREDDTAYLAKVLTDAGAEIVGPPGMHAIYLNAQKLLPHLPPSRYPGHSLACQLFLEGGIRCAELGSLYLGELDSQNELVTPAPFELVRLAVPRRMYGREHFDYAAEVLAEIVKRPEKIPGYRFVHAPAELRHFEMRAEPVTTER